MLVLVVYLGLVGSEYFGSSGSSAFNKGVIWFARNGDDDGSGDGGASAKNGICSIMYAWYVCIQTSRTGRYEQIHNYIPQAAMPLQIYPYLHTQVRNINYLLELVRQLVGQLRSSSCSSSSSFIDATRPREEERRRRCSRLGIPQIDGCDRP